MMKSGITKENKPFGDWIWGYNLGGTVSVNSRKNN